MDTNGVQIILVAVIGTMSFSRDCLAARRPAETVAWSDLGRIVQDKQVTVVLTNGKPIEGQIISVSGSDTLLMDIKKSSDPAYLKGAGTIQRQMLSELEVTERKGWVPIVTAAGISAAALAVVNPIERFDDKTFAEKQDYGSHGHNDSCRCNRGLYPGQKNREERSGLADCAVISSVRPHQHRGDLSAGWR